MSLNVNPSNQSNPSPSPSNTDPSSQTPDKNSGGANLRKAVEYLVIRRLAGNNEELEALRLAIVEGMSPSEVSKKLGVPRASVKTAVYAFEKIVGDHRKATEVLKTFLPAVMKIQPVMKVYYGKEYVCVLCGLKGVAYVNIRKAKLMHIKQAHKDLIDKYVDEVMAGVRA